jgi:secreted trypsin-like serine protease
MAGFNKAFALVPCSVVLSMAVGCGTANQSTSEQKVYGGTRVPSGGWQNVVAITQRSSGMYCTGTAIAPTVVITAAHCAKGFKASNVAVYVGDGREGGRVTGQYQAKSIKYSPKYSVTNDIAYIVLTQELDLPADAYIPVLTEKEEIDELLKVGGIGHIVGFGNRDDGGFGVKFEVDGKITKLTSNEVSIGGSGKDSCQGDSGGPVFGKLANGEWRVYGVTSRGGACGTGGIYGLMHANICWVQEDSGVDLGLPEGTCD